MPTTTINPQIELLGYDDLLSYAADQTGMPTASVIQAINNEYRNRFYNSSLTFDEAKSEALASWLNQQGFNVQYNGNGKWMGSAFQTVAQVETPSIINSNTATVSRGNLRQMYGNVKEFDGSNYFMQMSRFPASGGLGTKAMYVLGSAANAIGAVSSGIALGKIISPLVYKAAPDFWDNMGISEGSFQPETWNTITNGDDSPFAGLFNFILGLDPDSGTAQAYMDENAFAYYAYAMLQNGVFDRTYNVDFNSIKNLLPSAYANYTANVNVGLNSAQFINSPSDINYSIIHSSTSDVYFFIVYHWYQQRVMCACSLNPFDITNSYNRNQHFNGEKITINGKTFYAYLGSNLFSRYESYKKYIPEPTRVYNNGVLIDDSLPYDFLKYMAYSILFAGHEGSVEGITNQPDATLPDTSNWNDIASTLNSLKQQYPDMWNNAMTWNNDEPNSNSMGDVSTWIPVPFPITNSMTDTQPVTGDQTQTSLQIDKLPATDLQTLLNIIQAPQTETESNPIAPPENPTDTGTGNSPIPVAPTGSASALWSVYHPTQQQVNDFGAWLWTDNIITQFVQAMNNPMDGIITLHKIFAPPVDSGNGTIVIGRLDSQVPTALVTQQYVSVDCGSVSVQEYFGNVFDYVGTQISIYLPFIGIQPLNVEDVMRSTLNVVYEVDLFTGACLATIHVNRDGYNPMMYQFTGVCSVEYPLTGGQHSSIINGFFGLMGAGVAAAAGPTGIIAAGATAIGVASSVNQMARTQNARSGAFGANAGAMGIKKPYLIISRPQTKVARQDTHYTGYPTNYTDKVSSFTGIVKARQVHVNGINATDNELSQIETLLKDGIII